MEYTITHDEICSQHGGHNLAYQYDDENFERIAETCEGCNEMAEHEPSPELQAERLTRHAERPQRPQR